MTISAPPITVAPNVAEAAETVPARHYTHHDERGHTVHRTNPIYVQRDVSSLDVAEGMNVLEVGTGSGYSGALLARLTGASGRVTSLDIDPYLTRWANLIHHRRGLDNIRCFTVDGTAGLPSRAPYDRIVAWCTPPLLPAAWLDQLTEDGLIVTPLPVAALPHLTVVTRIRTAQGQPAVENVTTGGYIDATASPKADLDLPGRWVDWENRHPSLSWISIAWRDRDDWQHTGARATLNRLLNPNYSEPADGVVQDWPLWKYWPAATGDPGMTMVGLGPENLAFGHSTPDSAAVITQDGRIIADSAESPSLAILRSWISDWNDAGCPPRESYEPSLVPHSSHAGTGWDLRLRR
ncbi:methyltransferase domain-containing protein [Streptomyces sparsogenes]|uniref:protein-L-isoaspartate O-methyltransferase family protein n=1 Tax=Streptomyces sparsogenes TaxID=67365 RepID=UPI0033EA0786